MRQHAVGHQHRQRRHQPDADDGEPERARGHPLAVELDALDGDAMRPGDHLAAGRDLHRRHVVHLEARVLDRDRMLVAPP